MLELRKIEQMLPKDSYWRSENGQILFIQACAVGDNFYDYGERPKHPIFEGKYSFLENDPRICLVECCECCGCAGWQIE